MAERTWLEGDFSKPYADPDPYSDGVGVLDIPKAAASRGFGIVGDLGASLRAIGESQEDPEASSARAMSSLGELTQKLFGGFEEATLDSLSPTSKRDLQATFTSPEFWTLNSIALKSANMAPDIAAAVVPAMIFPGAMAAVGIAAAQGGAFAASSVVDDMYKMTDALSDEELQEEVKAYRDMRAQGMDEKTARREWNAQFRGMRPLLVGAVGTITNALGPAGQAARAVSGMGGSVLSEAGEGIVKRVAKGAAEGSTAEAIQSGTEDYAVQDAAVEGELQENIDYGQLAESAAGGAVLGGVLGGGIGGVAGKGERRDIIDEALGVKPTALPEVVVSAQAPEAQPGVATTTATGVAPEAQPGVTVPPATQTRKPNQTPNGVAPVRPTAGEPVTTQVTNGVTPEGDVTVPVVPTPTATVVDAAAPDPAQAVAIANTKAQEAAPAPVIPPETSTPVPATPSAPEAQTAAVPPSPAGPAPIEPPVPVAPEPVVPAGPRILEDRTAKPTGPTWDDQIGRNIAQAETPAIVDEAPRGRNRNVAEQQARQTTRDGALMLVQKYTPQEGESGLLSKRPKDVTAARRLVLDRAKVISDEANTMGLVLPKAFRDNAKDGYNPETLLVMEARRLATKPNPTPADYTRFVTREFDVRSGGVEQAVAERRAEGDAAMRQSSETQVDTLTDAEAPVDMRDPEAQLIAREDEEDTMQSVPEAVDRILTGAAKARTEEAGREAVAQAERLAARKVPEVVAKKVRKVNKPEATEKVTPKVTPKQTDAKIKLAIGKMGDISQNVREDFAARKAQADAARAKQATAKADFDKALADSQASREALAKKPTISEAAARKVTEVKERIAAAREKTNTDPTPAQAVSGIYAKGRASIHGVEVAIENPKGSTRTNKDPKGPKWSVKLKNDYGYVEGTKGVDGDPIDVYVGPDLDATYVYVIDQMNLVEGTFDEHKVMMAFKDDAAAYAAYDAAFSDGRGLERIGGFSKMTLAEFKEWAKKNPKTPASGMTAAERNELRALMFEDEFDVASNSTVAFTPTPEGYVTDPNTGVTARKRAKSRKAADIIGDLEVDHLTGAERFMAGAARSMLKKLVGEVDVHFVAQQDIQRLSGLDSPGIKGYYITVDNKEAIFIQAELMNNRDAMLHLVLHEATHALTLRAIRSNPKIANDIKDVMMHVRSKLWNDLSFSDADKDIMAYGMTDPAEFVSEAFSRPEFQAILARMEAPQSIVDQFKLTEQRTTMWGVLVHAVRRALKLPVQTYSLLEAAIRVTEQAAKPRTQAFLRGETGPLQAYFQTGNSNIIQKAVTDTLKTIKDRPDLQPTAGTPWALGYRTLDHIARAADRYFGGNNPVRKIADLIERQRVAAIKEFDAAAPMIQKLHDLQKKYQGVVGKNGHSMWENFTSLTMDETMTGVYADRPLSAQKHITSGVRDSWQREQHPGLVTRFNELPQDLRDARVQAMDYFRAKQNEVALKLIRNRIVTLFDTTDPEGLASRIHTGNVTDADKALMGDTYDAIAAAGVLSKIDGPYMPLMRRGNWVVKGKYPVTPPKNGTMIEPNEFEFTTSDAAEAFSKAQGGRPTVRTVYVDKATGERFGEENGVQVRLTAQDMNAEARYRVVVQDRHMEMFDSEKEARQRVAELRAKGIAADDAVPRSFENMGIQGDALSTQMRRLSTVMERKADARNYTPDQKADLMKTIGEMSLHMLASTRIATRALPRQYVAGASKDLVLNTTDYAHSMGNYIAKLDHKQQIDTALLELDEATKANAGDGKAAGRTAFGNEVKRRLTMSNPTDNHPTWAAVSSRIMSLSFIDKLMSPSYSVINATQPMMITAPFLAARYGASKAYRAMGRAYSDVGSMNAIREGLAATMAKAKSGDIVPTDPVSLIQARLTSKAERTFIDVMIERGIIDTDSGLEVSKIVQDNKGVMGKVDTGIGYLEGIARQMPKTVEAINRTVAGLAAYRLEMERSGDVARATQYAQDVINQTQFNYSASNAAPFMNHPVLRLALQFKKYGIGMYQLMGEQMAIAIRNENAGDRAQAIKAMSYTVAMHVLVAGAMGLPTEPIKLIVTAANGLGVLDWNWGDVENAQREYAADIFGQEVGEVITRGLPRAFGVDLSTRMGIDTLMGPFGEPRSNEAQDWKAYAWDAVSGAPAGLVTDWARGMSSLIQGDFVRAAERLVPVKLFADTIKSYRTYTEGSVSERTGRQVMSPYSIGEAGLRAIGFAPAREAEGFERSGAFYRGRDAQKEVRSEFQREWVEANGAARGRIWREIQKWNRQQPREARLSLSDLRGYQKRLKADMLNTKEGIRARRNEQHLMDRADRTFNYLP